MIVWLNQEEQHLPEGATIVQLLSALGMTQLQGVALAVNNKVVPKSEWYQHRLQEGDRVVLIRATQGG